MDTRHDTPTMVNTLMTRLGFVMAFYFIFTASFLVSAQTLADTVITNSATATYTLSGQDDTQTTNTVNTTVVGFCDVNITPDGDATSPAYNLRAYPGDVLTLEYQLTNTGNTVSVFDVSTLVASADGLSPLTRVVNDTNANGLVDTGEVAVTQVTLAAAETRSLLIELSLSDEPAAVGVFSVNLTGSCESQPDVRDENNASRIMVLLDGVSNFVKTSTPAAGAVLSPGDDVVYDLTFTVNETILSNITLTDVLSPFLNAPNALLVEVDGVSVNNAASYDANTHQVTVSLSSLAPNANVLVRISTSVTDDAAGNLSIPNTAALRYDNGENTSNTVAHTTLAICDVLVSPDGSLNTPAYQLIALPGEIVTLPYTLLNTGNVTSTYELVASLQAASSVTPQSVSIVHDVNDNGVVDTNEPVITQASLAANASLSALIVVTLPADILSVGDVFINLSASCSDDINKVDNNNISQIILPVGGFSAPEKTALPATGTALAPGDAVRYTIEFSANGRDLTNVTITDPLDAYLDAPTNYTQTTVTDTDNNLSANVTARYDAQTHTMSWQFDRIPAGMTVQLRVDTSVRIDAPITGSITNTACITDSETVCTNTVIHDLAPTQILLEKTASPQTVHIGETLRYTLSIINPSDSADLTTLTLSDDLPEHVTYQTNSSRVVYPNGDVAELEPVVAGQGLTWVFDGLASGETLRVSFDVTVDASALNDDEIVNTALVSAKDAAERVIAEAADSVSTPVELGVFEARSVLMGTVYIDVNGNDRFDAHEDQPVEGVRLYLSDGRSLISDSFGRYTFLDLTPGIESLRVDVTTLPARLLKETRTETKTGLWRVVLNPGLIAQQDIPFLPAEANLVINQVLNVEMGPVALSKRVLAVDDSGVTMRVVIDVTDSLKQLEITEALPANAILVSPISVDRNDVKVDGLTVALGDVQAGYSVAFHYTVAPVDEPKSLLTAPLIRWSFR